METVHVPKRPFSTMSIPWKITPKKPFSTMSIPWQITLVSHIQFSKYPNKNMYTNYVNSNKTKFDLKQLVIVSSPANQYPESEHMQEKAWHLEVVMPHYML